MPETAWHGFTGELAPDSLPYAVVAMVVEAIGGKGCGRMRATEPYSPAKFTANLNRRGGGARIFDESNGDYRVG